eukprot:8028770-Pyramimonas_sp.AAC.1
MRKKGAVSVEEEGGRRKRDDAVSREQRRRDAKEEGGGGEANMNWHVLLQCAREVSDAASSDGDGASSLIQDAPSQGGPHLWKGAMLT